MRRTQKAQHDAGVVDGSVLAVQSQPSENAQTQSAVAGSTTVAGVGTGEPPKSLETLRRYEQDMLDFLGTPINLLELHKSEGLLMFYDPDDIADDMEGQEQLKELIRAQPGRVAVTAEQFCRYWFMPQ